MHGRDLSYAGAAILSLAVVASAITGLLAGCRGRANDARLPAPPAAQRLGIDAYVVERASAQHVEVRLLGTPGALRIDAGDREIVQAWERGDERVTVTVDDTLVRFTGTYEGALARGRADATIPDAARPFFAALAALDTELAVQGTALVGDPESPSYAPCTLRCASATACLESTRASPACAEPFAGCVQCLRVLP